MAKLKGLGYYGGKAGYGKAEWIASLLPWERDTMYVEPFAGMLGVLLAREPVKNEIVNDLDGNLVNWWRVVREQPDEFGWLVETMPHSRDEYNQALARLNDESLSAINRALAFHTCISQSVMHTTASGPKQWRRVLNTRTGSLGRWRSERVAALAERVWNVQLENCDALDLLCKMETRESAVIYCDPPYASANTTPYLYNVDVTEMERSLQRQQGRVLVSGYGDEWDSLGWRRVEHKTISWNNATKSKPSTSRIEVAWMNYDDPRSSTELI